jgi:putative aldouronate transport system substrate-binding protein
MNKEKKPMSHSTSSKNISRRNFLRLAGLTGGAAVLAACTPAATPTLPPMVEPAATEGVQAAAAAATSAPAATVPAAAPTVSTFATTPDANGCTVDWNPTYPAFDKYNPPIEISVPFDSRSTFNVQGDSFTNNPMYKRVVDNLGIIYKESWEVPVGSADYYTRLNNDLAAGSLPDAFRCKNKACSTFIEPGAVEDITDIWEKTASDLTKQKKGYPNSPIWNAVKKDGRIYGIAYLQDGVESDNLAYIRQDLLDKAGLAVPKTLDEFTAVAKAFKDKGLVQIPIASCVNLNTYSFSLDPVFGAFGTMSGAGGNSQWWLKNADGTLRYGSLDDGVKSALGVMAAWYKDGLLDADFINKDESAANDLALAGNYGIFFAPWWMSHAILPDLYKALPDTKVIPIGQPVGPQGKQGRAGTAQRGNATLFRKGLDPKIIEAVIKHMNWQIEMHVNFEKYQQYGEYTNGSSFDRGYEWDLDSSCKMVIGKVPGEEWTYSRDFAANYPGDTYVEYQAEVFKKMGAWKDADPETLNMAQKFLLSNPDTVRDLEYYNIAYGTINEAIYNEFLGANTEAITAVLTDLTDLEHTTFLEIVTGARPLDDFETFKSDWMDRGGKVYTEEVNKWAAANK